MTAGLRRLLLSSLVSWALHGALLLLLSGLLFGGAESPSRLILELVEPAVARPPADEAPPGPAPPPGPVAPAPPRPAGPPAVVARPEPAVPRIATPAAERTAEPAAPASRAAAPEAPAATPAEGGPGAPARTSAPGLGALTREGHALIPPRVEQQTLPRYPESARLAGAQGTALLRVRVLPDGAVGEVLVERSAGHPDLDGAAIGAVRAWRFEPGRRQGEPVDVWVGIPVRFTLTSSTSP